MKKEKTGLTGFVREIYGQGFVWVMTVAALMSMLAAGARMVQILYLGRIVDGVAEGFQRVLSLFMIIAIALIIHLIFNALWGSYRARQTARLMATLRTRVAGRLCRADYAALERFEDGDILTIVTRDLASIRAWVGVLFQAGFVPVKLGFSLAACFMISWKMTLVAIPLVPVIAALGMAVSGSLYTFHVEEKAASGRLIALLSDTASFMIVVKTFCLERTFARKNRRALNRVVAARDRVARRENVVMALNTSLGHVGFVLIFLAGSLLVMGGEIEIGDMIAFIFLANFIGEGMSIVQRAPVAYRDGCAARQRLEQVLTMPEEMTGGDRADRAAVTSPDGAAGDTVDEVFAFDDVSFGYALGQTQLRHLSFIIRQGERVAVMGASGSGKSTLFKLMCGLYRPTAGSLRRQGRRLRDVPLAQLRADLSVAPQDSFLFFDTLAANVKIGRPTARMADVAAACRRARIHDVMTGLPDGYETQVVEIDKRLSRGQMQRLNVARALLKDAPVLLLDEPTSALDPATHDALEHELVQAPPDRTVIMIAHRLTYPEMFDKILVLADGGVAGYGHHDHLKRTCGTYRALLGAAFHDDAAEDAVEDAVENAVGDVVEERVAEVVYDGRA